MIGCSLQIRVHPGGYLSNGDRVEGAGLREKTKDTISADAKAE